MLFFGCCALASEGSASQRSKIDASEIAFLEARQIYFTFFCRSDVESGARMMDLSTQMKPEALAEESVDLNLRLMRWRLMPQLQTELAAERASGGGVEGDVDLRRVFDGVLSVVDGACSKRLAYAVASGEIGSGAASVAPPSPRKSPSHAASAADVARARTAGGVAACAEAACTVPSASGMR